MPSKTNAYLPVQMIYFLAMVDSLTMSASRLNNLAIYPKSLDGLAVPLSFLKVFDVQTLAVVTMLAAIFVPILCFIKFDNQWIRIANVLTIIISKGILFSLSRYSHQYWPMFWALIFFAVPKTWIGNTANKKELLFAYKGAVLGLLLFYFYPGFWKLVEGLKTQEIFNIEYGGNMIASFLTASGKESLLGSYFINRPILSYLSMMGVLIGQLSALIFFFKDRYLRYYLIFVMGFHVVNIFVLNINFLFSSIVAVILFFFYKDFTEQIAQDDRTN